VYGSPLKHPKGSAKVTGQPAQPALVLESRAMSQQAPYDLVITGGTVIDPAAGRHGRADVALTGGKVAALGDGLAGTAKQTLDASGLIVTPGLIDLHAHVYAGCTSLSVDADPVAARSGTTTMVDCGSVGAATFAGFRRYVANTARCRVLAFVNISVIGLVAMPECGFGRFVDPNAAYACVEANRDLVVGIKVRGSRNAFGEENSAQPVWHAVAAAGAAGVPVMLHLGDPPPALEQGLEILRPGDLVTHSYKGQPVTRLVDRQGRVKQQVRAARDRGLLFDIGHGSGSFSWQVAHHLAEQEFWPDTISTDVHTSSIKPPIAVDMPNVMSKLLHLGMDLEAVIAASTIAPARAIGWADRIGSLQPGMAGDVAILALEEGTFPMTDSYRQTEEAKRRLVARHTICGGQIL
jgi:dihydroorotase